MLTITVPILGDWEKDIPLSSPGDPTENVAERSQLWTASVMAAQEVARSFAELQV